MVIGSDPGSARWAPPGRMAGQDWERLDCLGEAEAVIPLPVAAWRLPETMARGGFFLVSILDLPNLELLQRQTLKTQEEIK